MAESFFKQVQNTLGKGKIARYKQFFHSVFKSLLMQTHKNQGLFAKGLKSLLFGKRVKEKRWDGTYLFQFFRQVLWCLPWLPLVRIRIRVPQ